jgi:D-xylose reductase
VGYRLFDGAYDYQNEKEAGQGIRKAIDEGLVKREDIFVTTKLWNNYHRREHALSMAKAQNEAWGLGYIDMFLIHFPCALKYVSPEERPYPVSPRSEIPPICLRLRNLFQGWWMDDAGTVTTDKVPIRETWEALESLVDDGIAKSIGVSNTSAQLLYDMQTYARHPISALQIEHHPYLVQSELIQMAQENGITVTGYSSFGPQSFLELPPAFRERAKNVTLLFDNPSVKAAASRLGVSPAQVLLRWATQRNIAVIPKSNNVNRLKQNLDVLNFDLQEDEIKEISALDKHLRFNDPGYYLARPIRIFA